MRPCLTWISSLAEAPVSLMIRKKLFVRDDKKRDYYKQKAAACKMQVPACQHSARN